MATFVRKRSLDRKRTQESSSTTSETISTVSFQQQTDRIKALCQNFQEIPYEQSHKLITDSINGIISSKKSILISQRLPGFKECFLLFAKYLQKTRLKAIDPSDQDCVVPLSIFRVIIDDVNKLTQDQGKDKMIQEVGMAQPIMMVLEGLVMSVELESQKKERKPNLMRKSSLKRVEELPTVRPSSRGKLSSLQKKDRLPSKKDILNIPVQTQQPSNLSKQPSSVEQTVLKLLSIVKNLSANRNCRRSLIKEEYLRLLNRYFCIWTDKNMSQLGTSIMVQISSAYRHLAVDEKSYKCFMASNCIEIWSKAIEMFPTSTDLMFNILRILSKISSYPECCQKLNEKKVCLKTLGTFFQVYRSNIHIIIRVAFVFANMTSFLADIRIQLYFDFRIWQKIYGCFVHYADSELKGKSEVEKMGISMAAWDYQTMKKQSDIEAIIKIIRLIANLFTVSEIGQDIYVNDSKTFKDLVVKLKSLLERKSIASNGDLITCILSCLTNVLYYDKEVLLSSLEHKNVKTQIVNILVNFIVQIDNEQICCESLRVISNITRMKQYVKCVMDAKIHEAILILLDSTSKQIVYYSLGSIINMLSDDSFKTQYKQEIVPAVIEILSACENEDSDLASVCLKVLGTIMGDGGSLQPQLITQIEDSLMKFGSQCDRIIIGEGKKQEVNSAQESRALINVLLNNMPEEKFICPFKHCGRKFADQKKLDQHFSRRHKT